MKVFHLTLVFALLFNTGIFNIIFNNNLAYAASSGNSKTETNKDNLVKSCDAGASSYDPIYKNMVGADNANLKKIGLAYLVGDISLLMGVFFLSMCSKPLAGDSLIFATGSIYYFIQTLKLRKKESQLKKEICQHRQQINGQDLSKLDAANLPIGQTEALESYLEMQQKALALMKKKEQLLSSVRWISLASSIMVATGIALKLSPAPGAREVGKKLAPNCCDLAEKDFIDQNPDKTFTTIISDVKTNKVIKTKTELTTQGLEEFLKLKPDVALCNPVDRVKGNKIFKKINETCDLVSQIPGAIIIKFIVELISSIFPTKTKDPICPPTKAPLINKIIKTLTLAVTRLIFYTGVTVLQNMLLSRMRKDIAAYEVKLNLFAAELKKRKESNGDIHLANTPGNTRPIRHQQALHHIENPLCMRTGLGGVPEVDETCECKKNNSCFSPSGLLPNVDPNTKRQLQLAEATFRGEDPELPSSSDSDKMVKEYDKAKDSALADLNKTMTQNKLPLLDIQSGGENFAEELLSLGESSLDSLGPSMAAIGGNASSTQGPSQQENFKEPLAYDESLGANSNNENNAPAGGIHLKQTSEVAPPSIIGSHLNTTNPDHYQLFEKITDTYHRNLVPSANQEGTNSK